MSISDLSLIVLIGYRGTGKTTVARLLADRLGWQWCDADQVLEARFGRTIRQIFADEGERGFRDKESSVLEELCRLKQHVIATGGGVILRPENRELLRHADVVIWLTADPVTIHQRLQQDASTAERRPALTQGGLAEIEELLKVRQPYYAECAHWTLDTVQQSPEQIAAAINAGLNASRLPPGPLDKVRE